MVLIHCGASVLERQRELVWPIAQEGEVIEL
jgi:hypothetical protein